MFILTIAVRWARATGQFSDLCLPRPQVEMAHYPGHCRHHRVHNFVMVLIGVIIIIIFLILLIITTITTFNNRVEAAPPRGERVGVVAEGGRGGGGSIIIGIIIVIFIIFTATVIISSSSSPPSFKVKRARHHLCGQAKKQTECQRSARKSSISIQRSDFITKWWITGQWWWRWCWWCLAERKPFRPFFLSLPDRNPFPPCLKPGHPPPTPNNPTTMTMMMMVVVTMVLMMMVVMMKMMI